MKFSDHNLYERVLTSFLIIPSVLLFVFIDNPLITIPLYVLPLGVMVKELFNLGLGEITGVEVIARKTTYGLILIFAVAASYLHVYHPQGPVTPESLLLVFMFGNFLLLSFISIFFKKDFTQCFRCQQSYLFVFFYLGFIFFHIFKLKYFFSGRDESLQNLGDFYLLLAVVICWLFDSGAYLFGRRWGHKKIGLRVSPQKSWVGLLAGLSSTFLAGILVSAVLKWIYPELWERSFFAEEVLPWVVYPLLGLVAQWGDLIASLHKRSSGVKDTGSILKGHGGFYDRNDSLIIVSAVFYYFLLYYHS